MSISVAIIIPVYREGSYIEKALHSIEKSVQFSIEKHWIPHVVLVVNNPISVSEAFRKDNQKIMNNLQDIKKEVSFPLDVLDYTHPGLRNGVGEARKIGMSFAIAKYLQDPKDRIVSMDADCTVTSNYVQTLFQHPLQGSAFTLYFEHVLDSESIIYYELYLRYLRWGLILAQNPFSYYSVGSCLGTTVEGYQKAGGMVLKSATEDFHFLNKLRRQGLVEYWTEATVTPSSRVSERVTLGTGYFLSQAKRDFDRTFQKLMIPSPRHFGILSDVWNLFWKYSDGISLRDGFEGLGQLDLYNDLHGRKVIEKIHTIYKTTTNEKNFRLRLLEVVDGLETLRLLRFLWEKEPVTMSKGVFLSYANELWSKQSTDPKQLLLEIREKEKSSL